MNWYRLAENSNLNLRQLEKLRAKLYEENFALWQLGISTPEIDKEKERLKREIEYYESLWQEEYNRLKPEYEKLEPMAIKNIEEGRPHEVSQEQFINYHRTGTISEDAYKNSKTIEDISWLGSKDKYPLLLKKQRYVDEIIEFRKKNEKLRYVKKDTEDEIVRDEEGLATYLSDEEVKESGFPFYDTTIVAFNSQGKPIGWVSNEFGTDGVWVVDEYQGRGIGTDLLYEFRKQFQHKRRIGQMTSSGVNMTGAYHQKLVEEALKSGKKVPQVVLKEYGLV